ncbi:hypothetical protein MoryE10_05190 [Methylogaea oryzae]|uniref:Wzt C-terminal domain-containing protein n=1 Tax=Methylogaea oryzae TaxID=1295382 RepID=A0A8D5AG23_9GAMM|nr:hypothetical protein MoryE10_05190 [Methylogaea oryzae]
MFHNAQILGLTREETLNRFDDIAGFADIGDFLDQPVKTYSSGMMMRLAFAVQTAVEPQILIVDEALSVGDMFFQAKCMARINKLVDSGVSLLFVSHDIGAVRQVCKRAVLIDGGRVSGFGSAAAVTDKYVKLQLEDRNLAGGSNVGAESDEKEPSSVEQAVPVVLNKDFANSDFNDITIGQEAFKKRADYNRVSNGDAEVVNVQMLRNGDYTSDFDFDDEVLVKLSVLMHKTLENLDVAFKVRTLQGTDVLFFDTRLKNEMHRIYEKGKLYAFNWKLKLPLMHGSYVLSCGLAHPPVVSGAEWQSVDVIPFVYEFRMSPRQHGMIDGYVTLPVELDISVLN